MRKVNIHKHVIPFLYTLLWGVGLYSCSWDWGNCQIHTVDGSVIQGISVIYLIFMAECVVNLWDIAYCHSKETFNANILYWLMGFISDVLATLILTLLFFKCSEHTFLVGCLIGFSMVVLKYINVHLTNNVDRYMRPIYIKTFVSTF